MYFVSKPKPIQFYNIIYFDYTIEFYQDLFVYGNRRKNQWKYKNRVCCKRLCLG